MQQFKLIMVWVHIKYDLILPSWKDNGWKPLINNRKEDIRKLEVLKQ